MIHLRTNSAVVRLSRRLAKGYDLDPAAGQGQEQGSEANQHPDNDQRDADKGSEDREGQDHAQERKRRPNYRENDCEGGPRDQTPPQRLGRRLKPDDIGLYDLGIGITLFRQVIYRR